MYPGSILADDASSTDEQLDGEDWEGEREDEVEDRSGAIMADWLDEDTYEGIAGHLKVVDTMGVGERVHIESEAAIRAGMTAIEGAGDTTECSDGAVASIL